MPVLYDSGLIFLPLIRVFWLSVIVEVWTEFLNNGCSVFEIVYVYYNGFLLVWITNNFLGETWTSFLSCFLVSLISWYTVFGK